MKKNILTFVFFMFICFDGFSRLYDGVFEVEYLFVTSKGRATYNYDIVNFKEVKNGPFKFVLNEKGINLTIVGSYKNNKKHGIWTTISKGSKLNAYYSVNYTNGKRNGNVISKFGSTKYEIFGNATFRNDTLTGLFSIKTNLSSYYSKIQLDKLGRIMSYEKRQNQELINWNIYRSTVFEGAIQNQYGDLYPKLGYEKAKNIVDSAIVNHTNVGRREANGYLLNEYYWGFDAIEIMALFSPAGFYQNIRDDFDRTDDNLLFKDRSGERVEYYPYTDGMYYFKIEK